MARFTLGRGVWQHRNCNDLQIEILKVQWAGPEYAKVKVKYWRKAFFEHGAILLDPKVTTERIQNTECANWRYVAPFITKEFKPRGEVL